MWLQVPQYQVIFKLPSAPCGLLGKICNNKKRVSILGQPIFLSHFFFKDQPTLNNMKNQHFTLAERLTDSIFFFISVCTFPFFVCWRPCPSHLPLRLSLLLASLTHLLCLLCPFQPFCLTFPSFFQPFLLFSMNSY